MVLDTNVLYAGLYSSQGASHQIIRAVEEERTKIVLSTTLLLEYEDILKRKQSELKLSDRAINEILNSLCAISDHQKIWFLWRPCLSDPKDDHVLELAVAAGAGCIVTHNIKDYHGAKQFGMPVLTPRQFLEKLS
jgi:putative PIN family toxin of toxin-antitoxin system